jgi:hypothetical protein
VDDNYCVEVAAQNGDLDTLKILVNDPRVDPSSNGNSSFVLKKITTAVFFRNAKPALFDLSFENPSSLLLSG